MFYRNGKEHGSCTVWNASGGSIVEGQYVDGKKDGLWKTLSGNQRWREGDLVGGSVRGMFGEVQVKTRHPQIAAYTLEALAPVQGILEEYVMVTVLTTRVPAARESLNKAAHEGDRSRVCNGIDNAAREVFNVYRGATTEQGFRDGIQAFCNMKFDPNRNPMMPDSPVLLDCTMSNVGGRGVQTTGRCVEVTPKACADIIDKMCPRQ